MTNSKPSTMSALCEAHLTALETSGKSESTLKSYAGDLALAKKHFGKDTSLKRLTKKSIEEYFASNAVNLTRKGTPKNKITSDKIKRVFRLTLTWAEEEGLIEDLQIPASSEPAKKEEAASSTQPKPPVLKKPAKKARTAKS